MATAEEASVQAHMNLSSEEVQEAQRALKMFHIIFQEADTDGRSTE